jgi:hypothetical protein
MQRFTLIYLLLLLLYTLRYLRRLPLHPHHHTRRIHIDIPHQLSIRPHLLNRYLLTTNTDLLLPIGYPLTNKPRKIFEAHPHLLTHLPIDDLFEDIDETDHQEKCLIGTMQYKASQFPNKLSLVIGTAAHFLVQILDGIMVEVGGVEVGVEFVEEVVVLV